MHASAKEKVQGQSKKGQSEVGIKNILILNMCGLYIINFFIELPLLHYFLSIVTTIVFCLCLKKARAFPRFFAPVMFITGLVILLVKGEGLTTVSSGVVLNLPLVTLVILVPLLSIPFKLGGYFDSILYYLKKMVTNSRKMFTSISLFLFCFGPILNLGSIRVANEMVKDLKLNPIMLAKAYLVGFSTVILWSPYFSSVALVLYYLKLSVTDYIYLGLSLAVIQLVIGNLLYRLYYNRVGRHNELNFRKIDRIPLEDSPDSSKVHFNKMIGLVLIMVLLMGFMFTLEYITKWPMMLLVSLISIIFPVATSIIAKKWKEAKEEFYQFNVNMGKSVNNEVIMFISAGIFASSLTGTSFAHSIDELLTNIADQSFLLFCITVILLIVILTYAGLHTIVVVTVLITQINPAIIGTTPEVLALLFMIGWSLSAALSPVHPLNLLISIAVGKSGVIVGLKWNGLYIVSMFVIGILFVYLIH